MEFGMFRFDISGVVAYIQQGPAPIIFDLFVVGGWIILAYVLLGKARDYYVGRREDKATADWKWVLLAIDIPQLNVQTPLAVEQMFAHLAGALEVPSLADKLYGGYRQRNYSFEILSIEGYIQFLVRTEASLADLVETAIYAQYPEVQITEVEDYIQGIPDTFPNATHDIWISEFGLAENDAYPIRTYREFEHSISKDTVLKDPMGTFLESFSRIGPGEQMWFQIIVEPVDNSWKAKAIDKIKEIIDPGSAKAPDHLGDKLVKGVLSSLEMIGDQLLGREASSGGDDDKKDDKKQLTPGQGRAIEDMENKISKIGYKTKLRGAYLAQKEVFRPERGVQALLGAINQYNIPSENSIVRTATASGKENAKKTSLLAAFKKRKLSDGFIFNIEELATIWHFPMSHVKTPLVQKAQGKQAEPPASLPVGIGVGDMLPRSSQQQDTVPDQPSSGQRFKIEGTDEEFEGDDMQFG